MRNRLRLFLQVIQAVAYARGRLVMHRDLKPSNVLVTSDGQAHLLDFGIAKLLNEATGGETEPTKCRTPPNVDHLSLVENGAQLVQQSFAGQTFFLCRIIRI